MCSADLVLNATFERQELEKEKLVVIEELKNAEDDPEDIIHDYFEKALFPRPFPRESRSSAPKRTCGASGGRISSATCTRALPARRASSSPRPGMSTMTISSGW